MLKISTLKKNTDVKYADLSFGLNDIIEKSDNNELKLSKGYRMIRENDLIKFEGILSGILFTDERVVKHVDDEYFYIDNFNDIESGFIVSKIDNNTVYFESPNIESLIRIVNNTPIGSNCEGAFKVDNGIIRKIVGFNKDNVVLSKEIYNKISNVYFIFNDIRYDLKNCITPCYENGDDNPKKIIWECDNDDILEILNNNEVIIFYENNRFFEPINDLKYRVLYSDYSTSINTTLKKTLIHINVNFNIGNNVMLDLFKEEAIKKIIEREKKSVIGEIVDYEKNMFEPVSLYETNGDIKYKSISKIEFNLHLRDRSDNYEKWNTSDEKYWNQYAVKTVGSGLSNEDSTPMPNGDTMRKYIEENKGKDAASIPDHIYYLGFDKNDVLKSKNKLKKSFIRLSVYDTTDRNTQSLLYYSTIFFRYGDMYKKLINNEFIGAQFFSESKHSLNYSSDGFYMYLFNNVIGKENLTPLYLKIEFNHAKYGKTIPMILPTNISGPIKPTNADFPLNFTVKKSDTKSYSNSLTKLYDSLYIKFYVKYLQEEKRFVWFLPWGESIYNGNNDENKIVFNLFEPRINGWEEKPELDGGDKDKDNELEISDIIDDYTIFPEDIKLFLKDFSTNETIKPNEIKEGVDTYFVSKNKNYIVSREIDPFNAMQLLYTNSRDERLGWKAVKNGVGIVVRNYQGGLLISTTENTGDDENVEISLTALKKDGSLLVKKIIIKYGSNKKDNIVRTI